MIINIVCSMAQHVIVKPAEIGDRCDISLSAQSLAIKMNQSGQVEQIAQEDSIHLGGSGFPLQLFA